MTGWKRDERPENVRTFGDFKIFSEVNSDRETAHVVVFPDGREIRVLPDPDIGGRSRAAVVREAVEALSNSYELLGGAEGPLRQILDPSIYLFGVLAHNGLEWEDALEVSIEEWLEHWFDGETLTDLQYGPTDLLADLKSDGWKITREGET